MELIALSEFMAIFLLLAETISYLDTPSMVAPVSRRGSKRPFAHWQERGATKATVRQD
jgi:hypothetical protein